MDLIIIFIIIIILIFYYLKNLNSHVWLNEVNKFLKNFHNNKEFLSTDEKWFKNLRDNYTVIRDEYIEYTKKFKLKRLKDIDDYQKINDVGDIPWEIIMLKIFNKETNQTIHFPKTMKLMNETPDCYTIMFSVLKPGKKVPEHVGAYDGILRYHLSLIIPKEPDNCFLKLNGIKHVWKEGGDVMFDDTFSHSVENNTDDTRVVLFLDIKRDYNNLLLNLINNLILKLIYYNDTINDIVKNS